MKTSNDPKDFDRPVAVSGVRPQAAGSGKRRRATLSPTRTSSSPEASCAARRSICCAARAFVALARILSAALEDLDLALGVCTFAVATTFVGFALIQIRLPAEVVHIELGTVRIEIPDLVHHGVSNSTSWLWHQAAVMLTQKSRSRVESASVVSRFVEKKRRRSLSHRKFRPAPRRRCPPSVPRLRQHPIRQAECEQIFAASRQRPPRRSANRDSRLPYLRISLASSGVSERAICTLACRCSSMSSPRATRGRGR